jgi:uncharacterized protein (TIGR03435 family)
VAFAVLLNACVGLAAQPRTFDVASIKRSAPDVRISEFQMRPGGRLVVLGMTLRDLIRRVYGLAGIERNDQVLGGPNWVRTDRFDVLAGTDADLPQDLEGRTQPMLAMLRTLLEDRFHLVVHTEKRETDVYALVLLRKDASIGSALHASTIDCQVTQPGTVGLRPDSPRWCGFNTGPGRVIAKGQTMKELAAMLANHPAVGRSVRDATGLLGRFDLQMEFTPGFVAGPGASLVPNPEADSGLNIFTAIQEQLGLKLQNGKAAVDYVFIERAEPPTEN